MRVETFTGSAYWASYLINGDASGLEPGEVALCDAWQKRIEPFYVVSTVTDPETGEGEEARFSWSYGLHTGADCQGGDVLDYVAHAPGEAR